MERTTPAGNRLPDIIVHNTPDNFTKIPNDTIRNPEMSWKAKGILTLILSNKQGWFSFKETIKKYGTDGILSIESGLRELEQNGYLIRLRYRKAGDPTKKIQGSTWICVDMANAFDWKRIRRRLKKYGMEPFNKEFQEPEKPDIENPGSGKPSVRVTLGQGNKRLKRPIIKKTNYKEDQKEKNGFFDPKDIPNLEDRFDEFWKLYPRKIDKATARKKWKALSKKPKGEQPRFETIKKAIQDYRDSGLWDVEKYIPYPATWLNKERWNDDIPKRPLNGSAKKSGKVSIGTMNMKSYPQDCVFPTGETYTSEGDQG